MRSVEELRLLAGAEFNAILAADPELKRLDALKYDRALDVRVLFEVLELGDWRIGDLPVRPLTAAKWAFLWALDNPLTTGEKLTPAAAEVALYILSIPHLNEIPCALSRIPGEARGLLGATGLPLEDVARELRSVVRGAFRPLNMLPPRGEGPDDEPPRYDGAWCVSMAGVAARESGHDLQYCLHRMSLSAVCACFVSFRRRESTDGGKLRYRPDEKVSEAIDARVEDLAEEWLTQKTKM